MIGLSACANLSVPPSTDIAAPSFDDTQRELSTPGPDSVILTAIPSPPPTATEKFVPKHNDLIFVEFFAVT